MIQHQNDSLQSSRNPFIAYFVGPARYFELEYASGAGVMRPRTAATRRWWQNFQTVRCILGKFAHDSACLSSIGWRDIPDIFCHYSRRLHYYQLEEWLCRW